MVTSYDARDVLMSTEAYINENWENIARHVHSGGAFTIHYWTREMTRGSDWHVRPRDLISSEKRLSNGVWVLESLRETLANARELGAVFAVVGYDNRCIANEVIYLDPTAVDCNPISPAMFVFPARMLIE